MKVAGARRTAVILLATRSGTANGASLNAVRLAAAFRAKGVPAQAWALYSTDGVLTAGMSRCFSLHPPATALEFVGILVRVARAIVELRPRAVIGFHPLANTFGLLVALAIGTRTRIASQRNPSSSQRNLLRGLDLLAGTFGVYTCNVCVSPSVERTYRRYPRSYRRRIEVIWNGVPAAPARPRRDEARARFGLPATAPVVGTLGRLDPQKNQEVLIEAVATLASVHLVFAGDGELHDRLRSRAVELGLGSRVHFLGNLEGGSIVDLLTSLDVFAFPSRYEGFGLALVEAMQIGLPCVVSDIEVFRDILSTGPGSWAGLFVPVDDPRAWGDALGQVLTRHELAAKLGTAAAARSRRFQFQLMAEDYLRLVPPTDPQ